MSEVLGHVDGFSGSYLNGWAASARPDRTCRVEVIDEAGHPVASGIAARPREDLAALSLGRCDLGFSIPLAFGGGSRLRVMVDGAELPGSPIAIGADRFDGYLEVAGGFAHGWISRRSDSTAPVAVTLRLACGTCVGSGLSMREPAGDAHFRPYRFEIPLDAICVGRSECAITLLAEGSPVCTTVADIAIDGFLDAITPETCVGWLLCPNTSHHTLSPRPLEIVAFRDGSRIGSALCDLPRRDLRERYPHHWQCGFVIAFDRPDDGDLLRPFSLRLEGTTAELFGGPFIAGPRAAFVAAARRIAGQAHQAQGLPAPIRALLQTAMNGYLATARAAAAYAWLPGLISGDAEIGRRPVDIVVPIYRGGSRAESCIRAALDSLGSKDRLVLIAEAPPDPAMREMLDRHEGVTLLANTTLDRALDLCREGDVLLLDGAVHLHPGGLDEMRRVLHASPDIATVTAMSDHAGLFTYPHPSLDAARRPEILNIHDTPVAALAEQALRHNRGLAIDMPTGHAACLLIRREVLDRLGGPDPVDAFCARASDLGFRHVAAAGTLVSRQDHASPATDLAGLIRSYPEYPDTIAAHERTDPLRVARWPLDAHRLAATRAAGIRYALTVENWLEGGTARAAAALAERPGYGDRWTMRLAATESGLIHLTCKSLRLLAVFAPHEHAELLALLNAADIDLVIFHQLIGYQADMIQALGDWSRHRNAIGYIHDFYAICPRATLIDASQRYCGTATAEICTRCIALAGPHPGSRLQALTVPQHRTLFANFLASMSEVITPSRDTAFHLHRQLPTQHITAIGHPDDPALYPAHPRTGDRTHILLLGAIGPHKGADRLQELAATALLTHPHLRFTVVGHTSRDAELRKLPNIHITGRYRPSELPALLSTLDASLALFLHIWPETFSYTLSEAVQAGFFPIVPDLGAPAERVRDAGFGVVYPPTSGAAAILNLLDGLPGSMGYNGGGMPQERSEGTI